MTTIKEISIQEVAQPYSIKIERGQKGGYGYELGVKSETWQLAIQEIREMKKTLEDELYGGGKNENKCGCDLNPV